MLQETARFQSQLWETQRWHMQPPQLFQHPSGQSTQRSQRTPKRAASWLEKWPLGYKENRGGSLEEDSKLSWGHKKSCRHLSATGDCKNCTNVFGVIHYMKPDIRNLFLSSESVLTATHPPDYCKGQKNLHEYYVTLHKINLGKYNQGRVGIVSWRVQAKLLSLHLNKAGIRRKQDRGSKLFVVTFNLKWILLSERESKRSGEKAYADSADGPLTTAVLLPSWPYSGLTAEPSFCYTRKEQKGFDPAYKFWALSPADKKQLINGDLRSERISGFTDLPHHPNTTTRFPNCSCVSLHTTCARESGILRSLKCTWWKEYKLHKLKAFKSPWAYEKKVRSLCSSILLSCPQWVSVIITALWIIMDSNSLIMIATPFLMRLLLPSDVNIHKTGLVMGSLLINWLWFCIKFERHLLMQKKKKIKLNPCFKQSKWIWL